MSSSCTAVSSRISLAVPVNLLVSTKLRSSHQPVAASTSAMPPSTTMTVAAIDLIRLGRATALPLLWEAAEHRTMRRCATTSTSSTTISG